MSVTDRVRQLRQQSLDAKEPLSSERAELLTDFYRAHAVRHNGKIGMVICMKRNPYFLLVLVFLLTSCGGGDGDATATPTASVIPLATSTQTSTRIMTPTSTRTATPTTTFTATLTPTFTPTKTPIPYVPPTATQEIVNPEPTETQQLCWDGSVPIGGQCPPLP